MAVATMSSTIRPDKAGIRVNSCSRYLGLATQWFLEPAATYSQKSQRVSAKEDNANQAYIIATIILGYI